VRSLRKSVDSETLTPSLAVLVIARGNLKLGAMIIHLETSELDEIVEEYLAWKEADEETAN